MKANYTAPLCQWVRVLVIVFSAIVFGILSLNIIGASSRMMNSAMTNSSEGNDRRTSPVAVSSQSNQIEAEVITILPTGFQPAQITRPSGKFVLAIENRTGLRQVEFQLSGESGNRVFQASRTWERLDWSEVVDPPPGRYVLTEANHPGWQCVITINR